MQFTSYNNSSLEPLRRPPRAIPAQRTIANYTSEFFE